MISINIKWVEELQKVLDPKRYEKALALSVKQWLLVLNREERKVTPVDTWRLRNSREEMQSKRWDKILGRLVNFREYWPIVDYRQWFVKRWIDAAMPKIERVFNNNIWSLLQ